MYQSEQICGACTGNLGLPASHNMKTGTVAFYFRSVLATVCRELMQICMIVNIKKKKKRNVEGGHTEVKKAGKLHK